MKLRQYFPLLFIVCLTAAMFLTPGRAQSSFSAAKASKTEKKAIVKSTAQGDEVDFGTELLMKY